MSRALQLLASLQADGFHLEARGGKLLVSPASRLSDADRQDIRHHKAGLLNLLASDPDDLAAVCRALRIWGLL